MLLEFLLALGWPSLVPYCAADPSLPAPALVAPISMAPSATGPGRFFRYEFSQYEGLATGALLGITHEFLCHVPRASESQCTLGNHRDRLDELHAAGGNVIRMYAVLNHSPGGTAPFTDEQPFARVGREWNVGGGISVAFLDNLEAVVSSAYCRRIIVELTLLDPWDGDWLTGPFSNTNTTTDLGFAQQRQFVSWENLATRQDASPAVFAARRAQQQAVQAVVGRLKRYPNIIWEIANEPDLIPAGAGLAPPDVAAFESTVRDWITAVDTTHLIMVNGHATEGFAWSVPGGGISVASGHYVSIGPSDARDGAIEMLRDGSVTAARARYATAFNEGRAYGLANVDRDDIRSEAWDFIFNGGNSFDAYSIDYQALEVRGLTQDLGGLAKLMRSSPADASTYFSAVERVLPVGGPTGGCNGPTDWCKGVPGYAASDRTCSGDAKTYWSTLKSSTSDGFGLYLHHAVVANDGGLFQRYDARPCSPQQQAHYSLPDFQIRVPMTGCWRATWTQPQANAAGVGTLSSSLQYLEANRDYFRPSPSFRHDIAFFLSFHAAGPCGPAQR